MHREATASVSARNFELIPPVKARQDAGRMRAAPIDAIARRARGEAFLCQIDERRNPLEYLFLVDVPKRRIAFDTSGERVELCQAEYFEHLPHLLRVVVARDQYASRMHAAGREPSIAGENHTIFRVRDADHLIVIVFVGVGGIESQNAKPSGELAEHDIRDEFDIGRHMRRGTSMPIKSRAFVRASRTRSTTRI